MEEIVVYSQAIDFLNILPKLVDAVKPIQLKVIHLEHTNMCPEDYASIEFMLDYFKNLEYLALCNSSDEGMWPGLYEKISRLENLEVLHIDMHFNDVDYSNPCFGLKMTQNLSKLKYLGISHNIFRHECKLTIDECCPNLEVICLLCLEKEDAISMKSIDSIMK